MRKPVVRVIGQSGADLIPGWGKALISVTFTDNEGGDADELEFSFSVAPPFPAPPQKGTRYTLYYGWSAEGLRNAGDFTFQSASLDKSAGDGWVMTITSRSADFVEADKSADLEHFEATTAGEIFTHLAKKAGKTAMVDAALAAIAIPYRLRLGQSALGFGQALADEIGAAMKLAGGKWLVTPKGGGSTASGNAIPPITVSIEKIIDCGLSSEGRPEFADIESASFDEDTGQWVIEKASGTGKSAKATVMYPSASSAEAKVRAKAEAIDLERATISGSLTLEGDVNAMAGAPVILDGFGEWAGTSLTAGTLSHTFTFDDSGGWLMSLELAAKSA